MLASAQRDAVHKAAHAQLLVITGGPGVGKTTVVRAILDLFRRSNMKISLAAPTGRAARRMAEATGHPAQTIHRLLEFDPRTGTFIRNDKNKLDLEVLIVDESSMLDLPLAHALVRSVPNHARLVLVGDVDQLPSIGPGAVLRDIIESKIVETVRLTQIFRQSAQSKIVENAHRILEGLSPEAPEKDDKTSDFFVVSAKTPEQASAIIRKLVQERIPEAFHFDSQREVQVLTPIHKGAAGTEALNDLLQGALNPQGKAFVCAGKKFRVGDKVMQMRNNYDLEAFNGDIGIIEAFDEENHTMRVELEGRKLVYEQEQAEELSLAYACSIHKSQGSEYPAAIVVMLSAHFIMLARNLLYTAVTRGKKLVVLVTDPYALKVALDADRQEERATYLSERMQMVFAQQ
jgi:exodeoxyribonuclease V alpha subunit